MTKTKYLQTLDILETEHKQGLHKGDIMTSRSGVDCPICEHEGEVKHERNNKRRA